MEIKPDLGRYTVYASSYCALDSNVINGGGTDDTEALQKILDMALIWGHLHLIVDGAALVRGLRVHSNTTVECLDADCGFYLADGANNCVMRNASFSTGEITDKNIRLSGGTYNHNNLGQSMCFRDEDVFPKGQCCSDMLTCMKFFGVENLTVEKVCIENTKRYAVIMGNWKNVVFEDINIPTTNIVPATNQDGLHFHGPGENLHIRNIHGRGCDDFIALNTDEGDGVSSINGVVIDGVYLDNAYQAVRLLTKGEGVLENVSVKNVFGSVCAYGFYINQWTGDAKGHFKNISFENIFLKHHHHVYDYCKPFGFFLGGFIDNLTLKNLSFESDNPDFSVLRVSQGAAPGNTLGWWSQTHIKSLTLEDVYISDETDSVKNWFYIDDDIDVDRLIIRNAVFETCGKTPALINIAEPARVGEIILDEVKTKGFDTLVSGKCGKVAEK